MHIPPIAKAKQKSLNMKQIIGNHTNKSLTPWLPALRSQSSMPVTVATKGLILILVHPRTNITYTYIHITILKP